MVRILLTNDDGIHSDGLHKLELALREIGEVYVVAPATEMSGASHSLTLSRPLRVRRIDERHWSVDGTPTDCVTMALNQILPPELRPDICASGINYGPNLGDDASYSGTVAGALEATILGVPGLAFSLVATEKFDFIPAAKIALEMTRKALSEGLPDGTLLNINVPQGEIKGVRITRQGLKHARPVIVPQVDPRGKPYYWISEERLGYHPGENTDFEAVDQSFVSVTPMRSDMTNHLALETMYSWNSLNS
ncbi:MAG: 5'/3'-nucleotidase SurE [Pyrinomonadaceae bacterium]